MVSHEEESSQEPVPFSAASPAEMKDQLGVDETPSPEGSHPEFRVDTLEFAHGEVLRYRPERIRIDPSTGEPAIPLVFVQGINGDQKLPWSLATFAEEDQREVIGLRYTGKLPGAAKLTEMEGVSAPISDMDATQADDIVEVMARLGIDQADAVGESRGAIRLVAAWARHPELFRHVVLAQPAGQDGRRYLGTHVDAARQAVNNAYRRMRGSDETDPASQELEKPRGGRLLRDPLGWRREQVSVARAQMNDDLSHIPMGPDQSATILADVNDKAFRVDNLRNNIRDPGRVALIETNWGRHGFGFNRRAVRETSQLLQQREAERAVGQ
ncbi:MAG: alpha/beta hydrolase fold [Patescibacteria group bacterium]|jgi:pimeloyl-ACP methyl ester carboxylesterase|nr:alpha/beta hydrolase fold [Patescibacteria group bacterium]